MPKSECPLRPSQESTLIHGDGFPYFCSGEGEKLRIGYARVSATGQKLGLQRDTLEGTACGKTVEDNEALDLLARIWINRVRPADHVLTPKAVRVRHHVGDPLLITSSSPIESSISS